MPSRVVALLDKPSLSSYGMYAFVAEDDQGILRIHGLSNHPRSVLAADELTQLVASQSVLQLPDPISIQHPGDKIAGWIGREFQERLAGLGGPPLPRISVKPVSTVDGDVWIDTPERVYERMVKWIQLAARDVFTDKANARKLAELMLWVLPERDETRAAVWSTRPNEAERIRHLEWYARLDRDDGRPVEPAVLEERFEKLRHEVRATMQERLGTMRSPARHKLKKAPFFDIGDNGRERDAA
jgi:hypothetical protein